MAAAPMTGTDILNMSDEEFLKTNPDPSLTGVPVDDASGNQAPEGTETEVELPVGDDAAGTEQTEGEGTSTETDQNSEEVDASAGLEGSAEDRERDEQGRFKPKAGDKEPAKDKDGKELSKEGEVPAADPKAAQKTDASVTPAAVTPDYKTFFDSVMKPFKANGRTIELKTPEEVIQLMQMGANYTKKMQELVPHRKMITMLQNNGLLDEGKLSYLIDLSQKNPDAIKKLVKDAGIDPMEIDVNAEPAYREGNHRVSDEEVAFHTVLEDMKSSPERVETLKVINDGWDQASKEALWKNPAIMSVMHEQRESGVYANIANEIARRQTLGIIPAGTPFLHAYKVVGDDLYAQAPKAPVVAQPVATRVQAPKPQVTNSKRAAAVSPNRSGSPNSKGPAVDYLSMSDDDFLKKFEGRV